MINSSLSEYLLNIDNLRNIIRYQTAPRLASESVAEHSFFVAAYILKLYDYFDFDLDKALKMGILHDFAESHISDVPHPIKNKFPILAEQLNKAEYDVNKKLINEEFANNIVEFNNCSTCEGIIVALSDILSVISYSKYEMELGNSNYMKNVYRKAKMRVALILEKSEPYLRENYTLDDIFNELDKITNGRYI